MSYTAKVLAGWWVRRMECPICVVVKVLDDGRYVVKFREQRSPCSINSNNKIYDDVVLLANKC